MIYNAFMSYSHAAGGKLAPAFQYATQSFGKPWYRLRSVRIFRDRTNLSITPALWPSIEAALLNSEYFILLASPQAAASIWVQQEIDYWLKIRSPETLLLVLTEGDLVWSVVSADFDWDKTTAIPVNLRKIFKFEPLYIDLRWAKQGEQLLLDDPRFHDAVAELSATLRGKSKDSIIGEELRQHRNALRLAGGAVLSMTLLASLATWQTFEARKQSSLAEQRRLESDKQGKIALERSREAERQRSVAVQARQEAEAQRTLATERQKQAEEERRLAVLARREAEAQRTLATKRQKQAEEERLTAVSREIAAHAALQLSLDPELSLLLSLEALKIKRTAQAEVALQGALFASNVRVTVRDKEFLEAATFSPAGEHILTVHDSSAAKLWDAKSGILLAEYKHEGHVESATFSPDGKFVATSSDIGEVRVWDTKGGVVREIEEHDGEVNSVRFSPNGRTIVTACDDEVARVWDLMTGRLLSTMAEHEREVSEVRFNHNGQKLLTVSGSSVAVWNTNSGHKTAEFQVDDGRIQGAEFSPDGEWVVMWAVVRSQAIAWNFTTRDTIVLEHSSYVTSAIFGPSSNLVVTASDDGRGRVWELPSGRIQVELVGHEGGLNSAAFSDLGNWIVTTGDDDTARIWDAKTGRQITELRGNQGRIYSAMFGRNSARVLTMSDYVANVWESATDYSFREVYAGDTWSAELSPNGDWLISQIEKSPNSASLWSARTGDAVAELQGHGERIRAVAFSPDSELVVTGSDDRTARAWSLPSGRLISVLKGHDKGIEYVAFSPNGHLILTGDEDTFRLWDFKNNKELLRIPVRYFRRAYFSPDDRFILTVSQSAMLWDARAGSLLADLGLADRATFSPKGERVLVSSKNNLVGSRIVSVPDGRPLLALDMKYMDSEKFSPDGKILATAGKFAGALVWDAATGDLLVTLNDLEYIIDVEFSSDGALLMARSDGRIWIWDVRTWRLLSEMGHSGDILTAEFSPNGNWVLTGSENGEARVWNSKTGIMQIDLKGNSSGVYRAKFSSDGRLIYTEEMGRGKIYSCDQCGAVEYLESLARSRMTRDLTAEERDKFISIGVADGL